MKNSLANFKNNKNIEQYFDSTITQSQISEKVQKNYDNAQKINQFYNKN